ncbi:Glycine receptor subunit beta [Halotydeus destructor]|nr:Glycine receptor subunit beta [Halotydeus destructor]
MTTFKFILSLGIIISYLQIAKSVETWDANGMLPEGYNKLLAPTVNGSLVEVKVSMDITRFLDVNMAEETFKINCYLKQSWKEPRINFPAKQGKETVVLRSQWYKDIWRPSTYFFNGIDGSDLDLVTSPMFFELSHDGTVTMSSRMIVSLTCDMNMVYYPHDSQSCFVHLESMLSESAKEVKYEWEAFNIDQRLGFRGFEVDNIRPETGCLVGEDQDVNSRCLKGHFQLHRQIGHYVIRVYAPSFLIVITTFLGFWIPTQAYPARTLIVVLPLLSLITQQSQVNREVLVSYAVALDIWYMACSLFIFMALLELAAALVYKHQVEDKKEIASKKAESTTSSLSGSVDSVDELPPHTMPTLQVPDAHLNNNFQRKQSLPSRIFHFRRHSYQFSKSLDSEVNHHASHHHHHEHVGSIVKQLLTHVYGDVDWRKAPGDRNKIDYCSRIVFPLAYLLFCVCYFIYLMQ